MSAQAPARTTGQELAWATAHALERGATWGPTCECVDAIVAVDREHDDMPARCVRCGRRERRAAQRTG